MPKVGGFSVRNDRAVDRKQAPEDNRYRMRAKSDESLKLFASPLGLLGAVLIACVILLLIPLRLPIGSMYWDVIVYYDGANRVLNGQTPIVDFFAPVGPLGYYLFAAVAYVFPNAHPTLLAHWALLLISAPLMALVLYDVGKRSRSTAFALLIPFLIFALLPFNTREFYPFPGSDGFGIYNRQVCHMLYVLVAALLFVKNMRLLVVLTCLSMTALFLLKITGFIAGGLICFYAFMAGRVPFKPGAVIFGAFLAVLAVIELSDRMVSTYLFDILTLAQMNSGTIAPRFLQATSLTFGIVAGASVLICLLAWITWRSGFRKKATGVGRYQAFLDQDWMWLGVVLFAGILFETQNTGSQAHIFLWPVLLRTLQGRLNLLAKPALFGAVAVLVAAIILPPIVTVVEKAARAYIGSIKNVALDGRNLKTIGAVNMRPDVAEQTQHMLDFYPAHRKQYEDLIAFKELPTPLLYSDFDFQVTYLKSVDNAIDAIRVWEQDRDIRFETIMSLNFVNPFPWLMDRQAPLYIAIGADPMRAVPALGSDEETAASQADLALYPTCPPTIANAMLYDMYKNALSNHVRVKLTECYDAFVHPKFAGKFSSPSQ